MASTIDFIPASQACMASPSPSSRCPTTRPMAVMLPASEAQSMAR